MDKLTDAEMAKLAAMPLHFHSGEGYTWGSFHITFEGVRSFTELCIMLTKLEDHYDLTFDKEGNLVIDEWDCTFATAEEVNSDYGMLEFDDMFDSDFVMSLGDVVEGRKDGTKLFFKALKEADNLPEEIFTYLFATRAIRKRW